MSQAYLVKLMNESEASGDYVGLFVVPRRVSLGWAVDEITNPYECLCRPIHRAAVFFKREIIEPEYDEDEPYAEINIDTSMTKNGIPEYLDGEFETGVWSNVIPDGFDINGNKIP